MKKLNVGDVIYSSQYGGVGIKMHVIRTTPTQAICENRKFKREYNENEGIIKLIGESIGRTCYYIATPELDAKYERKLIEHKIQRDLSSLTNLTLDQLRAINSIINPH